MYRLTLLLALVPVLAARGDAAPTPAEPGFVGLHLEPAARLSADRRAELHYSGDHGAVVAAIVEKGPAAAAGLAIGDRMIRFGSFEVPDLFSLDDEANHLWRVAIRMMLGNARAGEAVPVVVERAGVEQTLTLTPVSAGDSHGIQADEAEKPLPSLAEAGPPQPYKLDFSGLAADALLPAVCFPYEGRWRVVRDAEGPNVALRQDRMILPWAVMLVAGKGRALTDGKATVRFLPVSGVVDASGGIIFRAQDPRNYYVVRPNALEDNYRLYIMKDGVRTQLSTVTVTPPKKGTWHVFEVTFRGPHFRATLDGKDLVEATDETFKSGWCGLWTKADSVTLFDDLEVVPLQ